MMPISTWNNIQDYIQNYREVMGTNEVSVSEGDLHLLKRSIKKTQRSLIDHKRARQ